MLRFLRIFLLLRRSLAFVSTEKIAGSIVSIVIAVGLASAFFKRRVEHDAPSATMTTFRAAIWWAVVTTTTTVGYGDYIPGRRRRPDRGGERHRASLFVTRQSEPGMLEMTCQRSSMHWEAAPPSHC
jgi:hypothetical protein